MHRSILFLVAISSALLAPTARAQTHLWSQRFGDSTAELGRGVAVDGSGNVVVSGYFQNTVDFGGGPLQGAGSSDIFVARFDSHGNHVWSQRFGNTEPDLGHGVAVDGSGNVVLTGEFGGMVAAGAPVLLYLVAGLRPIDALPRWAVLPSVSAYYYTGAVGIFVGVLFALSLFRPQLAA